MTKGGRRACALIYSANFAAFYQCTVNESPSGSAWASKVVISTNRKRRRIAWHLHGEGEGAGIVCRLATLDNWLDDWLLMC